MSAWRTSRNAFRQAERAIGRGSMAVPTISQVRPGSAVAIVLKQDQRSGREVQGSVQDVLTSGNHPRGIKVRLQDGRIGRVQRMVLGDIAAASSDELQKDLQDQNIARGSGSRGRGIDRPYQSYRLNNRYTDIRQDETPEEPPAQLDLMSFVKEKKPKKGKKRTSQPAVDGSTAAPVQTEEGLNYSDTVAKASCPVCGTFEGDETAVAHHVEQHFAGE